MSIKRWFSRHPIQIKKQGQIAPIFVNQPVYYKASNKPTNLALKQELGLADIIGD